MPGVAIKLNKNKNLEDINRFGKKTKNFSQSGPVVWPVIANKRGHCKDDPKL